jgi:TusA-related sulfurtransferase
MTTQEDPTATSDTRGGPAAPGADAQPLGKVVHFDAGWLGCDRLPMIQRRQLQQVEVGDIVEFRVYDPSSKEDVPSFARMLGHRIAWIKAEDDGALLIAVERMR